MRQELESLLRTINKEIEKGALNLTVATLLQAKATVILALTHLEE